MSRQYTEAGTPTIPKIFQIAEIADAIAVQASLIDSKTCLKLAHTCRTLYDPGMNAFWYFVSDFSRLICCFPRELRPRVGIIWPYPLVLKRPPDQPEDWSYFLQSARRVRVLRFLQEEVSEAPLILRILTENPPVPSPIFPNLKELNWMSSRAGIDHYSRIFLGPQLVLCNISSRAKRSGPSIEFLTALSSTCPNLRAITYSSPSSDAISDAMNTVISTCTHLASFRLVQPISSAILRCLAANKTIRELTFDGSQLDIDKLTDASGKPNSSFPVLEILRITDPPLDHPSFLGCYLRTLATKVLQSFEVTFYSPITKTVFLDSLGALSMHRNLQRVHLHIKLHREGLRLSSSILKTLYGLGELFDLSLWGIDLDFSHEHIEEMGRSWPRMRKMVLWPARADDNDDNEPTLRLEHLRLFSKHLPYLWELSVPFDATTLPPPEDPAAHAHWPNFWLHKLGIPFCPIAEENDDRVAAFILDVYPEVRLSGDMLEMGQSEEDGVICRTWRRVAHMIDE